MSAALKTLLLGVAAILFVGGAFGINWQRAGQLERELAAAKSELETLHIEHRDTMDAINSALDAREAINEQAKLREKRLGQALGSDPLAHMPLSDGLREALQWDTAWECPASGDAAAGCADSGSEPDTNRGRHGDDNSGR